MKPLTNIEFYTTPQGEVMIVEQGRGSHIYDMTNDRLFTESMLNIIREFYTQAYKTLCDYYIENSLNRTYYQYLMVHRFIRCNFSEYDNICDISHLGNFNFEFVKCPLRGECKYCDIICSPKFNSSLSQRELQVMALFYNDLKEGEIADKLFISIQTVRQHKRNSLVKLKLHSLKEFIIYAKNNNLFNY